MCQMRLWENSDGAGELARAESQPAPRLTSGDGAVLCSLSAFCKPLNRAAKRLEDPLEAAAALVRSQT